MPLTRKAMIRPADIATAMHGEGVVETAKILSMRHAQYTKFMMRVAKHIVEAYLIHKLLLERESMRH